MQTFYVDVYFLINFTVDTLSLYFASAFSGVVITKKRILFSSILGALFAVWLVLLPDYPIIKIILSFVSLLFITLISTGGVSYSRKVKLAVSFIIFSALFGGAINFLWGVFDTYISEGFSANVLNDSTNRKLLLISIAILISIGVFKMIVAFFGRNYNGNRILKINIGYFDKEITIDAFVDTGNLATDPMDMSPILFLKKSVLFDLLPKEMLDLHDPDLLSRRDRKRIRLIPITNGGKTGVFTGFKPDKVTVIGNEEKHNIRVTVAIDKEGGNYGGYYALMPAAALDNDIR